MAIIHAIKRSFQFIHHPSAGGLLLLSCVLISILLANSPVAASYQGVLEKVIGFQSGGIHLSYSVTSWINDGLMAIFFLMAGLEIKREIVEGELSDLKSAAMPVLCAVGGMLVPAVIYYALNRNAATAGGWGIPMATDIAFAVAILIALKRLIPQSLKVFLTALAIVDDLGAIIVVAIFYTAHIEFTYLLYAAAIFALMLFINRLEVKSIWFYLLPGILMWYFVHHSGIHATIAGVLTAMAIPVKTRQGITLSVNLEHQLAQPVALLILPLFALANTNIAFEWTMLAGMASPLGLGIIAGLVAGKPIGIVAMAWAAVKARVGKLPDGANWIHIIGLGLLAGIGFTMSIFISLLSFTDGVLQTEAKFAVLVASVLGAVLGYVVLSAYAKRQTAKLRIRE
jgi:NhaA family Na+:H+ antiporter